MQKPRKNAVKLLLLMDSGGTMIPFSSLLNDLFQAIHKSNHYKDVKTYYFHNCIYSKVYTGCPACWRTAGASGTPSGTACCPGHGRP